MPTEAPNVVINSSVLGSKVNWTAAITAALALITSFGVPLTDEQKVNILTLISVLGPLGVVIFRSFFPGATPTAPQLKKVIDEKKNA